MRSIPFSLGLIVVAVFLIAGFTKAAHPSRFSAELRDYGILPDRVVGVSAAAIPALEFTAAGLALTPETRVAGSSAILILLSVFTTAVVRNLMLGRRSISCACFGRRSQELSWAIPLRNALLALGAVGLLLAPASTVSASALVVASLATLMSWMLIEAATLFDMLREAPD